MTVVQGVTQKKVELDFLEVCARLDRLKFPATDVVVGIATGGMVPAALVADRLGCSLFTLHLNYRAEDNVPQRPAPVLQAPFNARGFKGQRVLLVDDVSVTGKTLEAARKLLVSFHITTLVMKGHADLVLFPEIQSCVQWPWKGM